jgi:class 3 adenylate cyclase
LRGSAVAFVSARQAEAVRLTEAITFSEPAARGLALHYYARMASLAVVALVFGWLQHIVAGDPGHMPSMGPGIALAIGVANGIAAWILFGPIRRCLAGRGDQAAAMARVVRLPRQSAVWTFVLSAVVMTLPFIAGYIQCPECAPAGGRVALLYYALVMSIHAVLMALFMYFFVDDYTAWLRLELYRLCGWEMAAGRGGVVTKLLVAYFATAAGPFVLVFLDVFFADRLEALQMLDLRQAFLLDTIGAVAMTGVAVVFIRRGLVRPLEQLLAAVQRVDAGDLTRRAPVVSDDELGLLTVRFNRMIEQLREKEFLRQTFGRYVPKHVADAIVENRGVLVPQQRLATILFTDIQDFTRIAERLPPDQLVAVLNDYFSLLVEIVERHGGVVTQFQGDALLVAYNVPLEDPAHAANAVRAALDIEREINHRRFGDSVEFITRVGVNTGVVVAGPIGAEHRAIYTVHGDAVNVAARLEALNKEHGTRILVAESTRQLAGSGFAFTALGEVTVRGKSEPVSVYTVTA